MNIIDKIEKYGYPEPQPVFYCPVCGAECEKLYKVKSEIVGCDVCVTEVDPYEEEQWKRMF